MEKTFHVTEDDYSRYSDFAASNLEPPMRLFGLKPAYTNVALWFAIVIIFSILFEVIDYKWSDFHWPTMTITALPLIAIIIFYAKSRQSILHAFHPEKNELVTGKRTIKLDEDGILSSSSVSNTFYKWDLVDEVINNEGNLYIFLADMRAQILPDSCFKSDAEREDLFTFLRNKTHHDASKTTTKTNTANIVFVSIFVLVAIIVILPWVVIAIRKFS